MAENSTDNKNRLKGKTNLVAPELFLFSGYMVEEKLETKNISPVQNQLLYVGRKGDKTSAPNNTPVLKTDEKGMIFHFNGNEKINFAKRIPFRGGNIKGFSPANEIEALIPPEDMVCRSAFGNDNWLSDFNDKMQEKIKSDSAIEIPKLKLISINRSELRPPLNTESDKEYRKWFNSINDNKIYGYIMPKTRAIFLVFNLNIKADDTEIRVWNPYGHPELLKPNEIKESEYESNDRKSVLYIATLTGTDQTLPEGPYKVEVSSLKNSSNTQHWCGHVAGNQKLNIPANDSYSLSFNIKFDIQNIAGEFAIVNADPISLEEALIKQYPHYYNYLLNDALNTGDGSSKRPNSKAHALTPMINMWETTNDIANLTNKTLSLKSPSAFLKMLTKNIHKKYSKQENQKLRQSIDLVYQTKSTLGAWNDLRGSIEDLLKKIDGVEEIDDKIKTFTLIKQLYSKDASVTVAASDTILAEKIKDLKDKQKWFGDPNKIDPDYKESLAKCLGISESSMTFLGKSLDVVDIANNIVSVVDAGFSLGLAQNKLTSTKKTLNDFTKQYLQFLGKKTDAVETKIEINFAAKSAELSLSAENYLQQTTEPLLKDNKTTITIFGYTDTVGTIKANQELAKQRANALKEWIVSSSGINPSQITTFAFGEIDPKIPAPSGVLEYSCAENRRCIAYISNQIKRKHCAPCRQAIDTLEKNRYLTVTQHMEVAEAIVDLLEKASDFALAVASIIPLTAPAAMAISLAKESVELAKTVDAFAFDSSLEKLISGNKISNDLLFESYSNQTLIRDLYNENLSSNKITGVNLSNIQLRLRAEAISGMLRLIVRASLAGKDEFKKKLYVDYKIKEYIKNFILNDGWSMPLHPPIAISMDEFWLFAINEHNKDPDKAYEGFGLDENLGVINLYSKINDLPMINGITQGAKYFELGRQLAESNGEAKGVVINQMYMMSITDRVPYHVVAKFQDDYPIHHIATTSIEKLVTDINPDYSDLKANIYEHMAIYFKDTDGKWKSTAANEISQFQKSSELLPNPIVEGRSISHDADDQFGMWTTMMNSWLSSGLTQYAFSKEKRLYSNFAIPPTAPIKIVIVFKNEPKHNEKIIDMLCPVSVQLHRYDNFVDIDGPKYKTIARKLMPKDFEHLPDVDNDKIALFTGIREGKQIGKGMYGCIIEPFYQLGTITRAGIKPCSTGNSLKDIFSEDNKGGFKNMKYGFTCVVGNEEDTKVKIPLHTKKYWDSSIAITDSFDDEITVSLDSNDQEQRKLLDKVFLANNSTPKTGYPHFFRNVRSPIGTTKLHASSYIRVGSNSSFIPPSKKSIQFDNFDWKTPVDFVFTLTCSDPQFDKYTSIEQNPDNIQASSVLTNTGEILTDVIGPSLDKMQMRYIGKVTGVLMPEVNHKDIGDQFYIIAQKLAIEIETGSEPTSSLTASEKQAFDKYRRESNSDNKIIYYHYKSSSNKITSSTSDLLKEFANSPTKYACHKILRTSLNSADTFKINLMISPYKHLDSMLPDNYLSAYDLGKTYHLFAASKSLSYQHPLTGNPINSIRPFGETNDFGDEYYEYKVKELKTSGDTALGKPIEINATYRFSAPKALVALVDLIPKDSYLSSPKWNKDHPNYQAEIKDWIKNDPTNTNGPNTLFKTE